MAEIVLQLTKHKDEKLLSFFHSYIEQTAFTYQRIHIYLPFGSRMDINNLSQLLEDDNVKRITDQDSTLIQKIQLVSQLITLTFQHQYNETYDIIEMSRNSTNNSLPIQEGIQAANEVNLVKKIFKTFDADRISKDRLGKEAKQYYEERDNQLQKLESVVSNSLVKFTKGASEMRTQLDTEYQGRLKTLEEQFVKDKERLYAEHADREATLDEREKVLEQRVKDIDDRESKHARRAIRENIKEELKESFQSFELTEGTQRRRWPVWVISGILLLGSVYFIITGSIEFAAILKEGNLNVTKLLIAGIKQILFAAAFGITSVFLIRWQNHWFQQHASEEFRLKRLNLDLDRASWIVEMAFEWQNEKGSDIPKELIEQLSRNLFVQNNRKEEPLHPADHLASSIFGASTEASIELPGGSKLRFDRKGIKRLNEDADQG